MTDMLVLGYRADGRPVYPIRGGADGSPAGTDPAGAAVAADPAPGAAASTASPAGEPQGAGDGAEEIEFSEESFKALIEKHNAAQQALTEREAAIEAERTEWREKVQRHSRDAAAERVKVRTLSEMIGQGATGKPGPKAAAKKTAAADAAPDTSEANARLAELSAQLEETRRDGLLLGARAALSEAGVPKSAVAKAVRLIDLDALERRGGGEIVGLDEQIAELKEAMPTLFAPPAPAPAPATVGAGNGTGTGARVLRAAPTVAGRGAAGRGAEPPAPPKSENILANRLLYGNDEGPEG